MQKIRVGVERREQHVWIGWSSRAITNKQRIKKEKKIKNEQRTNKKTRN
jgi:hypothetical protein